MTDMAEPYMLSLITTPIIKPEENISDLLKKDLNRGFRLLVEKYSSKLYWHIRRLVILHEDADDADRTDDTDGICVQQHVDLRQPA
jgi:hypothetical protein